jgi:CDP-glucose 4,6-dehydratase
MATNAMGTAHVCDALRRLDKPCALVVVTSDKCYANSEWVFGYRENDPMGGSDPYSASKGVAELIVASWRKSFFPLEKFDRHRKPIATVRAGNVIGAGDWAADRIVPDAIRALKSNKPILVRNPNAVRPWQHVLEPLSGYLALSARLLSRDAARYAEGWNFGPLPSSTRTVRELVETLIPAWGSGSWTNANEANAPAESNLLRLSIDKAEAQLGWCPVWSFPVTIKRTAEGYLRHVKAGEDIAAIRTALSDEIDQYVRDARLTHAFWSKS